MTAEKFFTSILLYLKNSTPFNAFDVFYFSLLNLRPLVFLRPVKVGSVFYRTPAPITNHHRRLYAIKFILQASRDKRGLVAVERIGDIINAVYFGERNPASEKKFEFYKEAMSNRSFIRFLKYDVKQS